jgi:hypothetical protein
MVRADRAHHVTAPEPCGADEGKHLQRPTHGLLLSQLNPRVEAKPS